MFTIGTNQLVLQARAELTDFLLMLDENAGYILEGQKPGSLEYPLYQLADAANRLSGIASLGKGVTAAALPGNISGGWAERMAEVALQLEKVVITGKRVGFETPYGWRYVDLLTKKMLVEVKSGVQDYAGNVVKQIQKDQWLISQGHSVEWHFFHNPITGTGAPTQRLLYELKRAGIPVFFH